MLRDAVRKAMTAGDVTPYRLAQTAGVPQSTVYRWLNEDGDTSTENIDLILGALCLAVVPTDRVKKSTPKRVPKRQNPKGR